MEYFCPFRKLITITKTATDENYIQESKSEAFAKCIGNKYAAYHYDYINNCILLHKDHK